ncbi:hypothetical protein KFU94_45515 [Chloroflexi bacterium TSY]|nr:hypothetical protein [Chloroflexi bacterium TSY]
MLQHCEREGSLDVDIRDEVPNGFSTFFAQYPSITAVYFNGKKAEKIFKKQVSLEQSQKSYLTFVGLPSTSPAHAVPKEEKLASWRSMEHKMIS